QTTPFAEIDRNGRLDEIDNLPVAEKHQQRDFVSKKFILDKVATHGSIDLYDARGFFNHSLGCNSCFRGDGTNGKNSKEWLTFNRPLHEIKGHSYIDLSYTKQDIDELRKRLASPKA